MTNETTSERCYAISSEPSRRSGALPDQIRRVEARLFVYHPSALDAAVDAIKHELRRYTRLRKLKIIVFWYIPWDMAEIKRIRTKLDEALEDRQASFRYRVSIMG